MLHRGKIAINPEVLLVRPLTRDDLAVLATEPRGPQAALAGSGAVAKIREPHHRLARLIAAGIRGEELYARSGYSHSRVASIQKAPAFIELVAHYREKVTEAFVSETETFVELATANMVTAERMLMEKLEIHEDEGTLPSIRELMSIRSDSADRLGYGKKNTNVNVNVDFARQMEQAIARSRGAGIRTIEARSQQPPLPPHDRTSIPPVEESPALAPRAVPISRRV